MCILSLRLTWVNLSLTGVRLKSRTIMNDATRMRPSRRAFRRGESLAGRSAAVPRAAGVAAGPGGAGAAPGSGYLDEAGAEGAWSAGMRPAGIRSACAGGKGPVSRAGQPAVRSGNRPVPRMRCSASRRQAARREECTVRGRADDARGGVDRGDGDRVGLSGMREGGMTSFRQSNTERFVSDV